METLIQMDAKLSVLMEKMRNNGPWFPPVCAGSWEWTLMKMPQKRVTKVKSLWFSLNDSSDFPNLNVPQALLYTNGIYRFKCMSIMVHQEQNTNNQPSSSSCNLNHNSLGCFYTRSLPVNWFWVWVKLQHFQDISPGYSTSAYQ